MTEPLAIRALDNLLEALQSIAELKDKSFHVLTQEELKNRMKVLPAPVCGIVYEGMTPQGQAGMDTGITPMQVRLSFVLVLIFKTGNAVGQNQADAYKPEALSILDTVRQTLRLTNGPFGPFWQFAGEMPADEMGGLVAWVQRWTLPAMFPAAS